MDFPGSGILEACLGGLWGISGGLLEISERSLGGFWEVSGRSLGGKCLQEASKVLESKSDANFNENANKFLRALTLPCVFLFLWSESLYAVNYKGF